MKLRTHVNRVSNRNRRFHMRTENLERNTYGFFETSFRAIKNNPDEFFKYTRMTVPVYDILLSLVAPKLTKRYTRYTISAKARLAITLA